MVYKFRSGTKELLVPKAEEVIKLNKSGFVSEQIKQSNGGTSWINGRNVALIRNVVGAPSSWCALTSMKTPNGSWEMGTLGENLYFSYARDSYYNAGTNATELITIYPSREIIANINWNNVIGKPTTFSPVNHQHNYGTWLGCQYASGSNWMGWYSAYNGSRRGFIQHDGSRFNMVSEVGSVSLTNSKGTMISWWSDSDSYGGYFTPYASGNSQKCTLGTVANPWHRTYVYYSEYVSSDERCKHDIEAIKDIYIKTRSAVNNNVYETFFNSLIPKVYKMNDNVETENNKVHFGFVAQDIAKILNDLDIDEKELGLIDHTFYTNNETGQEEDKYVLCYQEFIPLNTHMIQKLYKKVEQQQKEIDDLKEQIKLLIDKVFN